MKINKNVHIVMFLLSGIYIRGMQQAPKKPVVAAVKKAPSQELWTIVVPVVSSPMIVEGKIETDWYVLMGVNKCEAEQDTYEKNMCGKLDFFRLPNKKTAPLFSLTAAGKLREIAYRTLEYTTGAGYNHFMGVATGFSRKEYKYFYSQPGPSLPIYDLPDDLETKPPVILKKQVVFLELTRKKSPEFFMRYVGSEWKSNCVWIKIDKNLFDDFWYQRNVDNKLYSYVADCGSIMSQWPKAQKMLEEENTKYQRALNKPFQTKREQDLEAAVAQQAKESWFTFERAVYYDKTTPFYQVLSLENQEYPFEVDGTLYQSLKAYLEDKAQFVVSAGGDKDLQNLETALKAKLKNARFAGVLKGTADMPLIYADQSAFYGIGADGKGQIILVACS